MDGFESFSARYSPLDGFCDFADYGFRVCGGVGCEYCDKREFNLWEEFDLERTIGKDTGNQNDHDGQQHHRWAAQGYRGKKTQLDISSSRPLGARAQGLPMAHKA